MIQIVLLGMMVISPDVGAKRDGSLQGEIPEIDLNALDPKIKDHCHHFAVVNSNFDPYGAEVPTKEDYQQQHAQNVIQSFADEYDYGLNKNRLQTVQRERQQHIKNQVQTHAQNAQNYVKAYRECLKVSGAIN